MGHETCLGKCGSMSRGCNVDFNDTAVERTRIRTAVANREESVKDDEEDGDAMSVLRSEFLHDKYLNKFIYIKKISLTKSLCFTKHFYFYFIINFIFFESNNNQHLS